MSQVIVSKYSTLYSRSCVPKSRKCVTIPSWSPLTARARQQEGYDKEELLCMQVTPDEETLEDYELEPESWQISCLVSADTFNAGHDTGDVRTERMKST